MRSWTAGRTWLDHPHTTQMRRDLALLAGIVSPVPPIGASRQMPCRPRRPGHGIRPYNAVIIRLNISRTHTAATDGTERRRASEASEQPNVLPSSANAVNCSRAHSRDYRVTTAKDHVMRKGHIEVPLSTFFWQAPGFHVSVAVESSR